MSKRFRFRLQRLLELRRVEEKQALEGLGEALRGLRSEEERLRHLDRERGALWEDVSSSMQDGSLDGARLASLNLGLSRLEGDIAVSRKLREQRAVQVVDRQQDVVERRGAKKAMETLEDRAKERFFEDEARAEAHEIEEVATRRYRERSSS